jgi:hypothetical protein
MHHGGMMGWRKPTKLGRAVPYVLMIYAGYLTRRLPCPQITVDMDCYIIYPISHYKRALAMSSRYDFLFLQGASRDMKYTLLRIQSCAANVYDVELTSCFVASEA